MQCKREWAALATACTMLGYNVWTFARAMEYLDQRNQDSLLDQSMYRAALLHYEKTESKKKALRFLEDLRKKKVEDGKSGRR